MQPPLQTPAPGSRCVRYRGDTLAFALQLEDAADGRAWLRTTIGNAAVRRAAIVRHVEQDAPLMGLEWRDIPMARAPDGRFVLNLPLLEPGVFESKAFFLPDGTATPVWPTGPNATVKVEPAETCCANTIYTAFVRQFRPEGTAAIEATHAREVDALEREGYAVIPRSGTFRDLIRRLDVILDRMHCRILQLLPIHPTPTTYARMGRFGSPFAAIDFMDVDPALGEFDRQSTPLDQFRELLDAVHGRGARLFLDIPINHTGWGSKLQNRRPDWFERTPDRTFRSPGAWGVTWDDLSQLDFAARGLWKYAAEVFLFWCGQGVDGFRCDAGYMVPVEVWRYIVARVRSAYPDTIFLLEGLGGGIDATVQLLADAGLDWAYSELFQQTDRAQVERYLPDALRLSHEAGVLVHFAETHDNNRLAATSETYARMRTAVGALFSDAGAFGITAGVEWFARAKIDVHGAPALDWGAEANQVDAIARLNAVLRAHPAFHAGAALRLLPQPQGATVALLRVPPDDGGRACLVLANLDAARPSPAAWAAADFAAANPVDLLTGRAVATGGNPHAPALTLRPGAVLCLSADPADLERVAAVTTACTQPERARQQVLRALALDVAVRFQGLGNLMAVDPALRARALAHDPAAYCAAAAGGIPCAVGWAWPRDAARTVPVPFGFLLHVHADVRFIAEVRSAGRVWQRVHAVQSDDGRWFVLLPPPDKARASVRATLALTVFEAGQTVRAEEPVLWLPAARHARVLATFTQAQIAAGGLYALCTNGRGAMAQAPAAWGAIRSQYDALLAANLHPDHPVDRHVALTRCRMWLVYRGFSRALDAACTQTFHVSDGGGLTWSFSVPAGLGNVVPISVEFALRAGENRVEFTVRRHAAHGRNRLDDQSAVQVIVRPDIEDRSIHATTKAYAGPERDWPKALATEGQGFIFAPQAARGLRMNANAGRFTLAPEWTYMVAHPCEAERGLDPSGDLFSPGFFTLDLLGGQSAVLTATVGRDPARAAVGAVEATAAAAEAPAVRALPLLEAVRSMLPHFIVRRGARRTVIAGYPWFLDWGRDTFIALRGLIAAGYVAEAEDILLGFGEMEREGTLPNALSGENDANRETSDAPLWFIVATGDLLHAQGHDRFLDAVCGRRRMRDVLQSIGESTCRGTPTGVVMDPASGLVFSPAHFTWMDTNHPAGTPRQGYPVEIQALWYAALRILARTATGAAKWAGLAEQVRASLMRFFLVAGLPYLSDCLHADPGQGAADARADDHLRPNQLLAITLGALSGREQAAGVLRACEELLVPGAIRSLANRPVRYPLPVEHRGRRLNDPFRPYWGRYAGDEDTRRKPAYHNGTAWTWLFPSYAEALFMVFGEPARAAALSLLGSSTELINRNCVRQVPEIVDGDVPHASRGCGAQAWGASELYRVAALLSRAAHDAR